MSNWALQAGGIVDAVGQSNSGGTILTAGTAHVKGSYAQLIASTARDATGIIVICHCDLTTSDFLVDVAVGAAGSEIIIADNLYLGGSISFVSIYQLPINIPAGTRIAGRCQSAAASGTCRLSVLPLGRGWNPDYGGDRVTTYGAATADSGGTGLDPGGTANTKGAWTQITASTTNRIRWLIFAAGRQVNVTMTSAFWRADIGVGAAGSEVVIVPDLILAAGTANDTVYPQAYPPLPVDIPAGTRLAARCQCSIIDATDRLIDALLYGVE